MKAGVWQCRSTDDELLCPSSCLHMGDEQNENDAFAGVVGLPSSGHFFKVCITWNLWMFANGARLLQIPRLLHPLKKSSHYAETLKISSIILGFYMKTNNCVGAVIHGLYDKKKSFSSYLTLSSKLPRHFRVMPPINRIWWKVLLMDSLFQLSLNRETRAPLEDYENKLKISARIFQIVTVFSSHFTLSIATKDRSRLMSWKINKGEASKM